MDQVTSLNEQTRAENLTKTRLFHLLSLFQNSNGSYVGYGRITCASSLQRSRGGGINPLPTHPWTRSLFFAEGGVGRGGWAPIRLAGAPPLFSRRGANRATSTGPKLANPLAPTQPLIERRCCPPLSPNLVSESRTVQKSGGRLRSLGTAHTSRGP